MKAVFAIVIAGLLVCGVFGPTEAHAASAEKPKPSRNESLGFHLPVPPYPAEARQRGVTGSGICQVSFGATGHVAKATMTKSTGSKILDDNAVRFALEHWTGPPNQEAKVPVIYILSHRSATPLTGIVRRGLCRVTFDMLGHASNVVIIKSTGSAILDKNTVDYGQANWNGPANTIRL